MKGFRSLRFMTNSLKASFVKVLFLGPFFFSRIFLITTKISYIVHGKIIFY